MRWSIGIRRIGEVYQTSGANLSPDSGRNEVFLKLQLKVTMEFVQTGVIGAPPGRLCASPAVHLKLQSGLSPGRCCVRGG